MEDFTSLWCFKIGTLSRKINRWYNKRLSPYNITVSQSFVLFDLAVHEGSCIKDIAARVNLDSPAVTGLVDRLVKEELVERLEDPMDRRSIKVYLTVRGNDLVNELGPIAEEFNNIMHNSLKPEDLDSFERSLYLLDNIL